MPRQLALLLTAAAVLWAAAIVSVPYSSRTTPARLVQAAASLVCHQQPGRTFHIDEEPMPVCARCAGLYLAGALGALAAWRGAPGAPSRTRALLATAAIPTILTLVLELSGAAAPGNVARSLSALPLGAAAGWVFVRLLREEELPDTCAMIS